jgi:hypothetical protein
MCLIRLFVLIGHLYVNGMWLCVDLRMEFGKHFLIRDYTMCSKFVNHSSFYSEHKSRRGGVTYLAFFFIALTTLTLKHLSNYMGDHETP